MSPGVRRILAIVLLGALPIVVAVAMFAAASSQRLPRRGLPQRALPRGGAAARLGQPVPRPGSSARGGQEPRSGRRSRRSSSRRCRSSRPARPTGRSRSSGSPLRCSRCASSACATGGCTAPSRSGRSVIGEIRVSHLTPFLCVLVALAWRYRDVRVRPGCRGRARRRRQVLPLAARRLARRDRPRRERCSLAAAVAAASLAPRPPVHGARRLLPHAARARETRSTRTAIRRSGSSCRSAPRSGSRAPRRS